MTDLLQFGDLHSRAPSMQPVFQTLKKVSRFDLSVLLTGPSGVGKTRVAQAIHHASPRSKAPFVVVECASIPDALLESELFGHTEGAFTGAVQARLGAFRAADGGTLLLDEIGAASPALQVALLRALEEQRVTPLGSSTSIPVNVRILATTALDLHQEVEAQRFRPDLFYRLAVVVQPLPTLDERPGDVGLLAQELTTQLSKSWKLPELHLQPAALKALESRAWPGNIRELENAIKRAAALAGDAAIGPEHLPPPASWDRPATYDRSSALDDTWIRSGPIAIHRDTYAFPVLRDHLEALAIERALLACNGNQSEAAKLLAMPRRTLVHKIAEQRLANADNTRPEDD